MTARTGVPARGGPRRRTGRGWPTILLIAGLLATGCNSSTTPTQAISQITVQTSAVPASTGTASEPTTGAGSATGSGSESDSSSGSGSESASTTDSTSTGAPDSTFVTTRGRSFVLDGKDFRFVGVNIYDAAATDRYSCRAGSRMSDAQLSATLKDVHDQAGATVVRFWAYQTYTQGATYWAGMDQVIAAARALGMKVLPVLEDGPGNCTTSATATSKQDYDGDTWYSQGYKVPYGNATLSYRDYVRAVAAHYADDPTILGWSMMNEADTAAHDQLTKPVLVDFATDIAAVIRSVDPHHLLTVGTQGNGAPGASGPDFSQVYGLSVISFAEVHDWGYWGSDTEAMPGGTGATPPAADSAECQSLSAPIGCSFARAATLDKPLIVGEAGIKASSADDRERRAELLGAKMTAAFAAGAAGYLIWSVTAASSDGYDVLTTDDDPLLATMLTISGKLS